MRDNNDILIHKNFCFIFPRKMIVFRFDDSVYSMYRLLVLLYMFTLQHGYNQIINVQLHPAEG